MTTRRTDSEYEKGQVEALSWLIDLEANIQKGADTDDTAPEGYNA